MIKWKHWVYEIFQTWKHNALQCGENEGNRWGKVRENTFVSACDCRVQRSKPWAFHLRTLLTCCTWSSRPVNALNHFYKMQTGGWGPAALSIGLKIWLWGKEKIFLGDKVILRDIFEMQYSSYLKGEELEGVTDSLRDDTDILEVQRKAFLWGDWETMWQQEKEEEGATAIW